MLPPSSLYSPLLVLLPWGDATTTHEGETLRTHRVVDRRGEVYHLDGFLHRIGKAGLPAIPSESTR